MDPVTRRYRLNGPNRSELTLARLEEGSSQPSSGQGLIDFFAWIACGFHHHYEPTGRTKRDLELVFPVTFEQVRCRDCGHMTWRRV